MGARDRVRDGARSICLALRSRVHHIAGSAGTIRKRDHAPETRSATPWRSPGSPGTARSPCSRVIRTRPPASGSAGRRTADTALMQRHLHPASARAGDLRAARRSPAETVTIRVSARSAADFFNSAYTPDSSMLPNKTRGSIMMRKKILLAFGVPMLFFYFPAARFGWRPVARPRLIPISSL